MKNTNQFTTDNTTKTIKGVTTMKKRNIKTRIIAGALSAITVFSVGAIAISSASAAETNSSEYILQQNDANAPISFATVKAEDYGKQAGVDAANAAFDTLGNIFPGAAILVSPFKSLFNMNVNGNDPMTAVSNKLDKMDQKLDDITDKLQGLEKSLDRNIAWVANKTELSELKTNYRNLSAVLDDFANDVYAIETDEDLNTQQKTMKLATLKSTANFRDAKRYCNIIRDYMDGSNEYVSDCMFELLYKDMAPSCMIEREAYNKAFSAAESLTKQYLYAVSLLAECQKAADAVYFFNDTDVKALGDGEFKTAYNSFDKKREILDASMASKMLKAVEKGAKAFKKHDTGKFIFKTDKSIDKVCGRVENVELYPNRNSKTNEYINKSSLSTEDIKALAAYIRENYPNTSIYTFLKNSNALYCNFNIPESGTAYILTDANLETEEHDAGTEALGKYAGSLLFDCSVYAKGINIYNPKCEEESFLVFNYRRADDYMYFIYCSSSYYNCSSTSQMIATLGNPITADEKNEVKKVDDALAQEENTINGFSAWKNTHPEFAELTFEDYKEFAGWKEWNESKRYYHYDEKYFSDYIKIKKEFEKYNRCMDSIYFIQYMRVKESSNPKHANAPFEMYQKYVKGYDEGKWRKEYGLWLSEQKGY